MVILRDDTFLIITITAFITLHRKFKNAVMVILRDDTFLIIQLIQYFVSMLHLHALFKEMGRFLFFKYKN